MLNKEEEQKAIAEMQADIKAHPEVYRSVDDGTFNWEDVASGGYSAANSALFGIPDVIVKAASSNVYKELEALRARNKAASLVGEIGGAFVPTGGALAKVAGKGLKIASAGAKGINAAKAASALGKTAKAADTVGDIIKGTKELKGISGGLARGALTSAEQILPRFATGQADGKEALTGIALGAGISGVAKAIPSVFRSAGVLNKGESFTKPLEDALVDKELATRGISGKDIKMAINKFAAMFGLDRTGMAVNNADDIKKSALNILKKNDILNSDEAQAFIQGAGKKFETLNAAFDKSGAKLTDYADDIYKDPAIKNFVEEYGDEGKKYIDSFLSKLSKKSGLGDIKQELTKTIKFANKSTDAFNDATGDVASAIKNKLDDIVLQFDPNYEKYKKDWRALQPLRYMVARDKMSIAKAAGGSDTAAKLIATSVIGGGAGVTQALKGFDPEDPATWTPAAMKVVAGLVIGAAANKAVPGVTNFVSGKVAGAINNPKFLSALEKAGYSLSKLPIESISQGTNKFISGRLAEDSPEEGIAKTLVEQGASVSDVAQATDGSNISEDVVSAQKDKEIKYGPEYINALNEAMYNYWSETWSDEMSFADYAQAVAEQTDGYNPKKTASFLYPDRESRQKFLKDIDVTEKVSGAATAFEKNKFGDSFFDPKSVKEKKLAQANIVDAIASLVTKPGDLPSKADIQKIEADIQAIADIDATPEEKQQLLYQKLQDKYGLGYETIKSFGLV